MKHDWQHLNKLSFFKRFLTSVAGAACSAFGISCFYTCGLGADPISVFVDGQHLLLNLTYGQVTILNNVLLAVLMLFLARHRLHVATAVACLFVGPLIDFFEKILREAFLYAGSPLWGQIVLLAVGVPTMALGTTLFVTVDIGVGPFDFPPLQLCDSFGIQLKWSRMIFDALYVAVGILLGGKAGIGTIAGVLLTGPLLSLFMAKTRAGLHRFFGPLFAEDFPPTV